MGSSENINQRIGDNIKSLRKEKNLTQADLAEVVQYSVKNISDIENGKTQIKVDTLIVLSEFFNVPVDDIVNTNIKPVSKTSITYYNELKPESIEYRKYSMKQYFLYHFRTHDNFSNVLEKGCMTVARDDLGEVHTVELVIERNYAKQNIFDYNGTLVISGLHVYIYLNGKSSNDRALIILRDPDSYSQYIGGLGVMLSTSEGYKNSKPCIQSVLLSSVEIPESGIDQVKQLIRLPEKRCEYTLKYDEELDIKAYRFLKEIHCK